MRVGEVLGAAEDALAFGVYLGWGVSCEVCGSAASEAAGSTHLFVWHPWHICCAGEVVDLLGPPLEGVDFGCGEDVPEDEVAVFGEEDVLILCEGCLRGSGGRHGEM